MKHENTQEIAARIHSLRAAGRDWKAIATALGISPDTARRWADPDYAKLRREQNNASKKARGETKHEAGFLLKPTMTRDARELGERLKRLIPEDTRDLTGRLAGDPLFERSALYAKMKEGGLA